MHSGPCAHGNCTQVHLCATTNSNYQLPTTDTAHLHHRGHCCNQIHIHIHMSHPHPHPNPYKSTPENGSFLWASHKLALNQLPKTRGAAELQSRGAGELKSWRPNRPRDEDSAWAPHLRCVLNAIAEGETRECRRTCMTTAPTSSPDLWLSWLWHWLYWTWTANLWQLLYRQAALFGLHCRPQTSAFHMQITISAGVVIFQKYKLLMCSQKQCGT